MRREHGRECRACSERMHRARQVKRSISIADRYYIMMYESVKTNSTNVFQRWLRAYGKAAQIPPPPPHAAPPPVLRYIKLTAGVAGTVVIDTERAPLL